MARDLTTIPLTKPTRDRLRAVGRKGETYDELVTRLLDQYEAALAADAQARPPTPADRQGVRFERVR